MIRSPFVNRVEPLNIGGRDQNRLAGGSMTIRMRALRTFRGEGNEGRPKKDREFDVADERRAEELKIHGLAVRVEGDAPVTPPQNTMEQAEGALPLSQAGGATGEDNASSSVERVQAPPMPRSRRRRGARE